MKNKKVLLLLTCLLFSSCSFFGGGSSENNSSQNSSISSNTNTSSNKESSVSSSASVTTSSSVDKKLNKVGLNDVDEINDSLTFGDLFNLENKVEIKLNVNKKNLEALNKDYLTGHKSEVYHHAESVEIKVNKGDKTYTSIFYDVGIRQKGNTSRQNIYNEDNSLNYNHYKISFNELFDDPLMYGNEAYDYSNESEYFDYIDNRSLLGMGGIDIKWNKNYDATHIKEIQASKIYESNGILAQHVGLTTFTLNDVTTNVSLDMGVCSLFEQANKSFVKRSLKSDKEYLNFKSWKKESAGTFGVPDAKYGDLYKVSYGVGEGSFGSGGDLSNESGQGKRIGVGNMDGSYIPVYERKTNTDVTYDNGLLKGLLKANSISDYKTKMDLDYFSLVEACNYFIGNPDDFKNNNNNYMIYFRRVDGKAVIIPIDNDRCFGITKDYNPDGHGMKEMSPLSKRKANGGDVNNLFKAFLSSETYKEKYMNNLEMISKQDVIKEESFTELYNVAKNTYGKDDVFNNGNKIQYYFSLDNIEGNYTYEDYMTSKLNLLNNELKKTEEVKDGNYGDIYLNGSFADWNAQKNYKFTYKDNGDYEISFTPNKVENNRIKVKIYDGEDYSRIDWVIDNNDTLNLDGKNSSSFVIENVNTNSNIIIKINTLTKVCVITVTNN